MRKFCGRSVPAQHTSPDRRYSRLGRGRPCVPAHDR